MAINNDNICRLCLSVEADEFSHLDSASKEKLKLEWKIEVSDDFVVCGKCKNILEESRRLGEIFTKNDSLILCQKNKLNINNKVNLKQIISVPNCKDICRICLSPNEEKYFSLLVEQTCKFGDVLAVCFSGFDIELTANPVICERCDRIVNEFYTFKMNCLSVEEKIMQHYGCPPKGPIDLHNVFLSSYGREEENDFLAGFEVQDEDVTDIFDNIPNVEVNANLEQQNGINRKRKFSSDSSDAVVQKNPKLQKQQPLTIDKREILDDGLPQYKFDRNTLFNNYNNEIDIEEWVRKVDEAKIKFGWSDFTTIHKVLVRLKAIEELYNWFSSISDIMNWNEWKSKLILAFPKNADYHSRLNKMLARRKRRQESYVGYYKGKLERLKDISVTGEEAVSCIFGGISDIVISCVGRICQYKNPEDLLEYFQSCDDKISIEKQNTPATPKKSPAPKNAAKQCGNCNKTGHTTAECKSIVPQKSDAAKQKQQTTGKAREQTQQKKPANPRSNQQKSRPNQKPGSSQRKPGSNQRNPGSNQRKPGSNQLKPGLNQQKPGSNQQKPSSNQQRPGSNQQRSPGSNQQTPDSNQHTPGSNQPKSAAAKKRAKIRSPNKKGHKRIRPKCAFCGNFGHNAAGCKKVPKSRPRGEKCDVCGEYGHESQTCPRRWADDRDRSNDRSFQDEQWANETITRPQCLQCGKFGHYADECPRMKPRASTRSFDRSSSRRDELYNRKVCLRCFQMGHEQYDCPKYSQRSYRD